MSEKQQVMKWDVPAEIASSPAVVNRNALARNLATRDVPGILSSYVYLGVLEMRRLVSIASRRVLPRPFDGVGIELGAGCGLLSAIVALERAVTAIYAVEVCEDVATLLIPKVAEAVLGRDALKVRPVVGSFDRLSLPANSIDFVVEIDSLHHSDNLEISLAESARVLKRGGWMLCFDRAHANTVTNEQVEEMLAEVYSREFLVAHYYPADIRLTRRENGEHEYRMFEWTSAFERAGFRLVKCARFAREVRFKAALKGVLSVLPRHIRRLAYKSDGPTLASVAEWTSQRIQEITRGSRDARPIFAPKECTVFFCERIAC
jgi:ubiquinone/menaquinone biosynthesis C-methylase UbiE